MKKRGWTLIVLLITVALMLYLTSLMFTSTESDEGSSSAIHELLK